MAQTKKLNVKVGDQVTIISGFHKNETGEVIKAGGGRRTASAVVQGSTGQPEAVGQGENRGHSVMQAITVLYSVACPSCADTAGVKKPQ